MKKLIMSSLIVFMIFTVQKTWAQRPPSDRIDHLKTELNLTDNQVTQLEKIFESRHEEMQALRSADYKSREEKREAMQGFRESMEKEIEVVLDETQYAKFQEIKKERRGEHGPKR
jgi:Spy/CpxP family protein refolding chaperone